MPRRWSPSIVPAVAALALTALFTTPTRAQYGYLNGGLALPWENNRARVTQLSVAPAASLQAGGDRVLVYFTAGPDGRLPAEAVWQAAGAGAIENRGPGRLDGLSIELKGAPRTGGPTPPKALDDEYGVSVTTLIDNPRVLVTKHRYDPLGYGPLHRHGDDVLLVYLRGGYTWPAPAFQDAARVRRGDVGVIPASTPHRLANAGGDPLEVLVIVPR
jgi:quercetin dioxygenase-like cupin family protein